MTSTHENTQIETLPAMEKSRPPTGVFLYPYKVVGNCLFMEQSIKGTPINKKLCKETFLCNDETVTEFEKTLASGFEGRRDLFLKSGIRCHGRVPEMVAHLEVSMKIILMFLESRHALSAQRCEEISQDFTQILYRIASRQAENIEKTSLPTSLSASCIQ